MRGRTAVLVRAMRARRGRRGVTLVEVLIVLAIMALIAGGAVFALFPQLNKARVEAAVLGASTVKKAADVYLQIDNPGAGCPTLEDLVKAKKLEGGKTDDPWGTPYKISCGEDGEVRVISAGKDKKDGSADDIRDNFKKSDIEKVANL